ncbi:MAG: ABC-2 transporter permease [Oscillibacter sp.]|uniref:ABC-2 transporter permease n=1 Tax=Oscillibacter sp. TaxID=1945593 RepID=UPI00289A30E9|nr:ABC-2 transporter permease [Oscillibacter sp.]MEA4993730.1 ABC-2 transporter permease [Oscillibacter sp.]
MKALLKKDIFVLLRQMRMFLLMIAIFAMFPQGNMTVFAIVYCGMLPYTAMAYDERSKWDDLAAMMPYTASDMVLSKYVLGWLAVGCATVLSALSNFVLGLFVTTDFSPSALLPYMCMGFLMMAITMPLMFRFGVEKGRMFFILLMVVVAVGGAGLAAGLVDFSKRGEVPKTVLAFIQLGIPLLSAALTAASIPLSMAMYKKHRYG